MKNKKANHICKYSGCTLGENGGRKHYYACDDCDKRNNWRAVACCVEHFTAYVEEVWTARNTKQALDSNVEMPDKANAVDNISVEDVIEKPVKKKRKTKT